MYSSNQNLYVCQKKDSGRSQPLRSALPPTRNSGQPSLRYEQSKLHPLQTKIMIPEKVNVKVECRRKLLLPLKFTAWYEGFGNGLGNASKPWRWRKRTRRASSPSMTSMTNTCLSLFTYDNSELNVWPAFCASTFRRCQPREIFSAGRAHSGRICESCPRWNSRISSAK